jgi:membrane associated rhomboid family serine protease
MFPIRDHNPSGGTPYVTWALIAANGIVFALMLPLFADEPALYAFFRDWALIPAEWRPLSLLTSMFLHGGLMHIAGNMLFLWIFGDNLEDEMGRGGFLAFYLACGLGAGIAHVASAPLSPVPTVGASGAIAGVMGGYLLLFPRARVDVLVIIVVIFRILPVPAWAMLGLWFLLQVLNGAGSDGMQGGVAHWAHAGGFVFGVLFALPVWLKRGGPRFWQRTHGLPPHPAARYGASRVPVVGRRR